MLIASGTPIKAVQHRLGHASIVMTMDQYGHLLEDVDEELIAGLEQQLSDRDARPGARRSPPSRCCQAAFSE